MRGRALPSPTHPNRPHDSTDTHARNPAVLDRRPHTQSLVRSLRSAAMARGIHPIPFRTRKLSPAARMVLPGRPGGRVRRRRSPLPESPHTLDLGAGAFAFLRPYPFTPFPHPAHHHAPCSDAMYAATARTWSSDSPAPPPMGGIGELNCLGSGIPLRT